LGSYGTGAVMAVPAHDSRDYSFAKYFNLPIKEVVSGGDISKESFDAKTGNIINSDFLNGLNVKEGIKKSIQEIESLNLGKGKTNYRLRDAVFGRQRYWGEPIPIFYESGIPKTFSENDLPLILPEIDKYLPTESGEPPLARANNWTYNGHAVETTTMPGWAGSSWYFLRYMDPANNSEIASKQALDYWKDIDLYMGGSEHATGHLLYFRFWTKFLHDLGIIPTDEPAKKLINQGMIQGMSCLIYRVNQTSKFVSIGIKHQYETTAIHIDIQLVNAGNEVDIEALKAWRPAEFNEAVFELENGKLICGTEVGKMSKRWHNVVNPDDVCNDFGADTLRLYEMFLGPLQDAKPWSTQGIEGVLRFLKKFWRLFHNNAQENFNVSLDSPSKAEYKILHKTIKKISEDIDNFSFNTSVSAFMVCVNELQDLQCNKKEILEPLVVLLSPFAPHIAEELWLLCGNNGGVSYANWPTFNAEYLVENEFNYPISFNGKVRFNINFALDMDAADMEKAILNSEQTQKYLEGKAPKKLIIVKGKIVNVVV
jgi:leucyl-tRNA synthetase